MTTDIQAFLTSAISEASPPPLMQTSSPFHSPALASRLLEKVKDLKIRVAACGLRPKKLLAQFDPGTLSWRTAQTSLFPGYKESLVALPASGMMQSGRLYEAHSLAFSNDVKGFIVLPTPTRACSRANTRREEFFGVSNPRSRTLCWYIRDGAHEGRYPNPELTEVLMTFPVGYTDLQESEMPSYP